MKEVVGIKKSESWKMFNQIAHKYDAINTIISCGICHYWRHKLRNRLPQKNNLKILDLATGTGQIMFNIMKKEHKRVDKIIGLDLSQGMMDKGIKTKHLYPESEKISFVHGSATEIPYKERSFDCVSMVFGIRNVGETQKALSEMSRVIKKEGVVLIMEFSLPKNSLVKNGFLFYLRHILPKIAGIISGNSDAYVYLNKTIEDFPHGQQFADLMSNEGFIVKIHPLTFGIVTLYEARLAGD